MRSRSAEQERCGASMYLHRGSYAAVARTCRRAKDHFLAGGQRDLSRLSPVRAVSRSPSGNSDLVAGLHRGVFLPAVAIENIRRVAFHLPVGDIAFLICYVQIDETVGIRPFDLRQDSTDGDRFAGVV